MLSILMNRYQVSREWAQKMLGLAARAYIFEHLQWGILLAVFATMAFGYVLIVGQVSLFQIIVGGTAALYALRQMALHGLSGLWKVDRDIRNGLVIPFLLFLGILGASTVNAVNLNHSFGYLRNYLGSLLCAFLVAVLLDRGGISILFKLILGVGLASALLGLLQILVSEDFFVALHLTPTERLRGFVLGDNMPLPRAFGLTDRVSEFGKDMVVVNILAISLLFSPQRLTRTGKIFLSLAIATLALGAILTFMRSVLLSIGAGLAFMRISQSTRRMALQIAAATILFLMVVGGLLLQDMSFKSVELRWTDRPRERLLDMATTNRRIAEILGGLAMIRDYPLLGVGAGNFSDRFDEYFPSYVHFTEIDDRRGLVGHNVYLEIWAGSGIFALLAYLFILGHAFRNYFRVLKSSGAPDAAGFALGGLGAMAGLAALYFLGNYTYDNYLWLFVGLSYALHRIVEPSTRHPA